MTLIRLSPNPFVYIRANWIKAPAFSSSLIIKGILFFLFKLNSVRRSA